MSDDYGSEKSKSSQPIYTAYSEKQLNACCRPLNPEENKYLRNWDMATATALIFVCWVSPYEVAFVSTDGQGPEFLRNGANALFWFNRLIDLIFIVDMGLQFFIMFEVHHSYGAIMISDHKAIVKHYVKGWFLIDLVSILPFDLLGIFLQSRSVRQLKVLRIVRLLRLLKLMRLLRGLRLFKRWEVEISVSYRKITIFGLLIMVCLSAHWIGCFLGIIHGLQGDVCHGTEEDAVDCTMTWFSPAAMEIVDNGEELTDYRKYIVALYVAATVIVHPHALPPKNESERLPFIIMIFIGGFIWTRVISRSTAIITSMDRHTIHYQQTMDDLNGITKEKHFPHKLRKRLRAFFVNTRDSSLRQTWWGITTRMSPELRIDVLYQVSKDWARRVSFLSNSSKAFLKDLTTHMTTELFAQKETFGSNFTLYIMKLGMCNWSKGTGKVCLMRPGSVWGEEHLFLTNWELLRPNTVTTITFVEVLTLERKNFQAVCADYPQYNDKVRRYFRWYAMIRGILTYVANEKSKLRKTLVRCSMTVTKALDVENTDQVHLLKVAQAKRHARKSLQDDQVDGGDGLPGVPKTPVSSERAAAKEVAELEQRLTTKLERMNDSICMVSARQEALENLINTRFDALQMRFNHNFSVEYDDPNPKERGAADVVTFVAAPGVSPQWQCNGCQMTPSAPCALAERQSVEL